MLFGGYRMDFPGRKCQIYIVPLCGMDPGTRGTFPNQTTRRTKNQEPKEPRSQTLLPTHKPSETPTRPNPPQTTIQP